MHKSTVALLLHIICVYTNIPTVSTLETAGTVQFSPTSISSKIAISSEMNCVCMNILILGRACLVKQNLDLVKTDILCCRHVRATVHVQVHLYLVCMCAQMSVDIIDA